MFINFQFKSKKLLSNIELRVNDTSFKNIYFANILACNLIYYNTTLIKHISNLWKENIFIESVRLCLDIKYFNIIRKNNT